MCTREAGTGIVFADNEHALVQVANQRVHRTRVLIYTKTRIEINSESAGRRGALREKPPLSVAKGSGFGEGRGGVYLLTHRITKHVVGR